MSTESSPRKTALITGASTGLGAGFARHLAEEFDLVLVARNEERMRELAAELESKFKTNIVVEKADLTREEDLQKTLALVREDENLRLLINNAGFGNYGPFAEQKIEEEISQVQLNITALMRLTHAALPGMMARDAGAVINVSSMAAFQASPYSTVYGATKAFVKSFSEALREELRDTNVFVQALCPGFTRTEFQDRAGIDTGSIPAAVWMTPEDVARASMEAIKNGDSVCVPGIGNSAAITLANLLPRGLVNRVAGIVMRDRNAEG